MKEKIYSLQALYLARVCPVHPSVLGFFLSELHFLLSSQSSVIQEDWQHHLAAFTPSAPTVWSSCWLASKIPFTLQSGGGGLVGIVLSLEHVDVILSHIFPIPVLGGNCCPLCGSSSFVHCMPLASAAIAL